MVGWHHWLDGQEFEQALGVGDGQGGLVCCSPWGRKESDMNESLNWTEGMNMRLRLSEKNQSPFTHTRTHTHTHTHTHIILWEIEEEAVLQTGGLFLAILTGNVVTWEVQNNLVAPYRICPQCRRLRFFLSVEKIPWRRAWQPTPVFLPGKSPWTEEPSGL